MKQLHIIEHGKKHFSLRIFMHRQSLLKAISPRVRSFLSSLITALLIISSFPIISQSQVNSSTAQGRGGAVASVDRHATQVGIDVLKAGGNAIDAAVATTAALGVTEPFSTGIGGGGFMMIYLKAKNQIITLDGREEAPTSVNSNLFKDPDSSTGANLTFFPNRISNGAAVGVPGTLLTWSQALKRYGTWKLADTLHPAIALAQNGFEVDASFAREVQLNQGRFSAFSSTKALYLPNNQPPAVGSIFKNTDLAKTYQTIATQGVESFYRGKLGQAIVQTVQQPPTVAQPPFRVIPGGMTIADLEKYTVQSRTPIITNYRNHKIYSMNLPSSGITNKEVMNIVSGFNLPTLDRVKAWHSIIEAERLAFADRNQFLGDPKYVNVPTIGLQSLGFANTRRQLISDRAPEATFRAPPGNPLPFQNDYRATDGSRGAWEQGEGSIETPPHPAFPLASLVKTNQPFDNSTTHVTVADRYGNIVSYTSTIEFVGGSGIVVPGYGFLLNNELTDFTLTPDHPNRPEPSKRPLSSMSPTIMFAPNGQVVAFGSPGGSTIITTVLGIAFNMIDFNLSLPDAIAFPRISQRNEGVTNVDSGLEKTPLGQGLIALSHVLKPVAPPISEIGAATGIAIAPSGYMIAAAEPVRRGGGWAMTVNR